MEVTLIVVTLVSIALAIAMGILTWRLLQEERLRSDARVAALEQGLAETLQDAYVTQQAAASRAIATPTAPLASVPVASTPLASPALASPADAPHADLFARDDTDWLAHFPSSTMEAAVAARNGDVPAKTDPFAANDVSRAAAPLERRARAAKDASETVFDLPVNEVTDVTMANGASAETLVNANGGLFGQVEEPDNRVGFSRHVFAVAAVAAVMIGAVLAFWTIGRLMEPAADRPGTTIARAGAGGNGANAAAPAALELMALNQAMQDGTLTISGLVRNPRSGVTQERLTAVVFFFDGQGGFLSSTRAPLDYRALAPGEESPFQLSAPAPPGVARYRVSFRRDEGAVVPHVDRRQQVQQSLQARPDQHSRLNHRNQQEARRS